jgi:hypothetical protein
MAIFKFPEKGDFVHLWALHFVQNNMFVYFSKIFLKSLTKKSVLFILIQKQKGGGG